MASGYQQSIKVFCDLILVPITPVNTAHLCVRCGCLPETALQSPVCGCIICQECAVRLLSTDEIAACPGGQDECQEISFVDGNDSLFNDRAVQKAVKAYQFRCSNNRCPVTVTQDTARKHLEECKFRVVKCDCGGVFLDDELAAHKEGKCPRRIISCSDCAQQMSKSDYDSIHFEFESNFGCPRMSGSCIYCNQSNIIKKDLESHYKTCSSYTRPCEYANDGCKFIGTQHVLLDHIRNDCDDHLKLMQNRVKTMEQTVQKIEAKCEELIKITAATQKEIIRISSTLEIDIQHPNIADVVDISTVSLTTNDPFIWNVKGYTNLKNNKLSRFSRPIYAGIPGYRLCLKICPNGDGAGIDTHVSLFMVILKGQYDTLLSWPMRAKIRMAILSQNPPLRNISQAFVSTTDNQLFGKPTTNNTPVGIPQLALHDDVENANYIVDDSIFVSLQFDYISN